MYQGRTPRILNTSLALIALALAACNVASASGTGAGLVFNYPNFSGSPSVQPTGSVVISGSQVNLTNNNSHSAGGLWYKAAQNIQAFTTEFTFSVSPNGNGVVFAIQNSDATTEPNVLPNQYGLLAGGYTANGMGFGSGAGPGQNPLGNSIGIKFDSTCMNEPQTTWYVAPTCTSTGLYVDGGPAIGSTGPTAGFVPEVDLQPFNINIGSNHVMQAYIVYDGTLLTMVLTDTSTGATTRQTWPINIPAIVGANTAYVGFCSGTAGTDGTNSVYSWAFWESYNTRLATPTFSVIPGQYASSQSISLSGPAGSTIYYTTNGLPPTTASTRYTGTPISVSSSQFVQAVAVESGFTDSLIAQGNYQIQPSATPLVNFPSGFASAHGLIQRVGYSTIGGSIVLTDTSHPFEAAGAWYVSPVSVSTFNTTFTVNLTNATADGFAFVMQNYPTPTNANTNYNFQLGENPAGIVVSSGGPWTLGGVGTNLGYTGILTSIAVIFDCGSGNLTGLYVNGAVPTGSSADMTSSGVSLHSGHPLSVSLSYDGTTLVETVRDTVSSAKFTRNYTINIPSTVGSSTAYIGFTASTGYSGANQAVTAWTYSSGQGQTTQAQAVPAAPTNLVVH